MIVDTGSGITAFPCRGCGSKDCGAGYHTDALFDDTESETFARITDRDDCVLGTYRDKGEGEGECRVSMSYQEGSMWRAYEAEDLAYAGGPHGSPLRLREDEDEDEDEDDASSYSFRARFGCQTKITGLFITQLADGIAGMENSPSSLWRQMYDSDAIASKIFSMCFARPDLAGVDGTLAGAMTLGGINAALHGGGRRDEGGGEFGHDLYYAEDTSGGGGWYNVRVRAMYLRSGGGDSVIPPLAKVILDEDDPGYDPNGPAPPSVVRIDAPERAMNRGGVIVDSGTTDSYFQSNLSTPFKDAWRKVVGSDPPKGRDNVRLTDEQVRALPTLLIQLHASSAVLPDDPIERMGLDPTVEPGLAGSVDPENPRDVLLAMPPAHYMERRSSHGDHSSFSMHVHFTESSGGVLGANLMRGHDVVFDVENGRVGFAESDCDYDRATQEQQLERE